MARRLFASVVNWSTGLQPEDGGLQRHQTKTYPKYLSYTSNLIPITIHDTCKAIKKLDINVFRPEKKLGNGYLSIKYWNSCSDQIGRSDSKISLGGTGGAAKMGGKELQTKTLQVRNFANNWCFWFCLNVFDGTRGHNDFRFLGGKLSNRSEILPPVILSLA